MEVWFVHVSRRRVIPPRERRTVAVASLLRSDPGDVRAFVLLRTDRATLVARAEIQARRDGTVASQGSLPAWHYRGVHRVFRSVQG